LTGHKGAVLDLAFSPFNDDILATASEDTKINIWNITGGFEGHKTDPAQVLSGHTKKVGAIQWHPVADNVLGSAATDYVVKVWDVETGKAVLKVDGHTAIIQSLDWNYDGSQIVTNAKDKLVRILDPRGQSVVGQSESHVGVKGTTFFFFVVGECLFILVVLVFFCLLLFVFVCFSLFAFVRVCFGTFFAD
jgi:WD40 repeat protein